MFFVPHHSTIVGSGPEVRPSIQIPMIYEDVPVEPARWEYHVLTIDTREAPLPDAEQLTALGSEGWILAGIRDEVLAKGGTYVHYYFVRRAQVS